MDQDGSEINRLIVTDHDKAAFGSLGPIIVLKETSTGRPQRSKPTVGSVYQSIINAIYLFTDSNDSTASNKLANIIPSAIGGLFIALMLIVS